MTGGCKIDLIAVFYGAQMCFQPENFTWISPVLFLGRDGLNVSKISPLCTVRACNSQNILHIEVKFCVALLTINVILDF